MNMQFLSDLNFWMGTDSSLHGFMQAVRAMTPERLAELEKNAGYGQVDVDEPSRLLSKQGNVGVISIHGSLVNSDSWINKYYGATGYPEIRQALIQAAKDPEIQAIALDVKSGGGAVSGVSDTADLIRLVDAKLKPVHTFADGMMASAAYWLGCSARSVQVGNVAEIGSIGIIMVHREYTKAMEKEGITTNVLRSGKYKALVNSNEPLTEDARRAAQAQLDQLYTIFGEHVAERRGVTYAQFEQKMGQGREFIGQAAVDAGLADKVSSFDKFIADLQKGIDKKNQPPKYGANISEGETLKNALTEQDIAAIAAGAPITAAPEGGAAAQTPAPATTSAEVKPDAAADAATAPAAPAATAPAAPAPVADVVSVMQNQIDAAQAKLVEAQVALTSAQAKLAEREASMSKLRPIVVAAIANMRVACGGSREGLDALGDDALVGEHANLSAQFNAKFKAGGVSAAPAPEAKSGDQVDGGTSAYRQARLKATARRT